MKASHPNSGVVLEEGELLVEHGAAVEVERSRDDGQSKPAPSNLHGSASLRGPSRVVSGSSGFGRYLGLGAPERGRKA